MEPTINAELLPPILSLAPQEVIQEIDHGYQQHTGYTKRNKFSLEILVKFTCRFVRASVLKEIRDKELEFQGNAVCILKEILLCVSVSNVKNIIFWLNCYQIKKYNINGFSLQVSNSSGMVNQQNWTLSLKQDVLQFRIWKTWIINDHRKHLVRTQNSSKQKTNNLILNKGLLGWTQNLPEH